MPKVIMGNHSAFRVRRTERENIRRFYCDVLGCKLMREFDDKDDFRLGNGFYIGILYGCGDGRGADKGVNYATEEPLSDDDFLKAIFPEIKADDVAQTRRDIIEFGVRVLDVPDPHLYFQAPGGQVFRLIGVDEDLSKYEVSVHT